MIRYIEFGDFMKQVLNYFEQIENANNIAIIVHKNADMDAIGSAIALKRLIKKLRSKTN